MKFNQNVRVKPYNDMNTDLEKKQNMILKNIFFKLMNNAVFGKTMKNVKILNLSQQNQEVTIWFHNQIFILKVFHRISASNKNFKKLKNL